MKTALITGITGQDGSYLADILLGKGYKVHGLYRHSSTGNFKNIESIKHRLNLHQGDITDPSSIYRIIRACDPHEIYNTADQDNVDWSFNIPRLSVDVTYGGAFNLLEAVKTLPPSDRNRTRVFIPVSAMMFGDAPAPQNEETRFNPQSPYACAKVAVYHLARYYRQVHGMFVSTAILYNHDSERRQGSYLLHNLVKAAIQKKTVSLYDLDSPMDIGYASDYMRDVVTTMEFDKPDDYVISSCFPTTLKTIINHLERVIGFPITVIEPTVGFMRPGAKNTFKGSMQKFKNKTQEPPRRTTLSYVLMSLVEKYRKELSCE